MVRGVRQRTGRAEAALKVTTSLSAGADVLLETKFHPPGIREEWVDRPDLMRCLENAVARLVLVDAPAGYGKTTLVAQWRSRAAESRPFAWISLDEGDNDPVRLWQHLVYALQRACPQLDRDNLLNPLRGQLPDISGAFLPLLVNELVVLGAPVVIVLDDYHVIKQGSCHRQLEFVLAHLSASAQIVLCTRSDPPLPLGRLRASGDLVEIRMRELRFTPAEAGALICAVAAVDLRDRELADLVDQTEGWPAAVYLAALSLRGDPSPAEFVHRFTGSNRYVSEFLVEEVIARQPRRIQRFLTRTAILGRFTPALCDAVTGTGKAREIIDVLERENLFLVALDDKREWFRYHQLFAQMLLSQLARIEPGTVPVLHRRASGWHRQNGSADEAIGHALAAGDVSDAVELIARHWLRYADTGRIATVRTWLLSLGDDQIGANPLAAHCTAWVAALTGERGTVRHWLPVVEAGRYSGPLPDGMKSLQSSAALLQGTFGFDGLGLMRKSAALATELEDDPASPWYALARVSFGAALYLCNELPAAQRQLEEALLAGSPIAVIQLMTLALMSLVALEEGRLDTAQHYARAAHDIATDPALGLAEAPQATIAYTAVGAVYASQGRLTEASAELDHALQARRRWPGLGPWPTIENHLRLAPVLRELGDRPGAAALLGEARDLLDAHADGAQALRERLEGLERRFAPRRQRAAQLAEPLTERERGVLLLLRGTSSARQIAQELYLSGNTVRTHIRAIYRKLGVSSRHDAVERGRELGIW